MKYTVTYTLEVTDIVDSKETDEETLADVDMKYIAENAKEALRVDDVFISNFKYFVHDEEKSDGKQ